MIQNLESKRESQINSLETRIEKMQEMFNKDLDKIKKGQSIMHNAITQIKSTLERTNIRITEAEDRISEVEDRVVKPNEAERQKEKKRIKRNEDNLRELWDNITPPNFRIIGFPEEEDKKKDHVKILEEIMVEMNEAERKKEKRIKRNEDNLRDIWDNVKRPNIQIIGVPEEEDKKKDHEKILEEIIVENFPKMWKEIIIQVQETQRVPNRINPRRNTPRHILIKLTKIKHK